MSGPELLATCRSYEPDSGGEVVLDDGRCIRFAAAALAGTGVRHLRPGQRLRVRLDGRPGDPGTTVVALAIPSLPLPT